MSKLKGHVIPVGYNRDYDLFVIVKFNSSISVKCLCIFSTETAILVHKSKSFTHSYMHRVVKSLNSFGFKLLIDESIAYKQWLFTYQKFSNRI